MVASHDEIVFVGGNDKSHALAVSSRIGKIFGSATNGVEHASSVPDVECGGRNDEGSVLRLVESSGEEF